MAAARWMLPPMLSKLLNLSRRSEPRRADDVTRPADEAVISAFGHPLGPTFRVVSNAFLTRSTFDPEASTYSGGIYDVMGGLVIDSMRPAAIVGFIPSAPVSLNVVPPNPVTQIPLAIYGGHFFQPWGHFLIETLSTAALADQLPDVPVIFTPWDPPPEAASLEWALNRVMPLLRAAGWGDREIVVSSEAMQFGHVVVPQRLTAFGVNGRSIHPAFGAVCARLRARFGAKSEPGRRLLVSRGASHRREHPADMAIMHGIMEMGLHLIEPATLSPEAQVAAFSGADMIVGFSGSGLHNSMFMHPGTRVVEIGDNPAWHQPAPAQTDLCRVCNQQLSFVAGYEAAGVAREAQAILRDIRLAMT